MSKQKKLLFVAALLAIAGIIMFYYQQFVIPDVISQTESKVRLALDENAMPRQKVAVITAKQGISKYTVITEEILKYSITFREIPKKYIIGEPVETVMQIQGKISKEELRYGEQIALGSLSEDVKWFGEYERLKEYHIVSTVAGILQSGNIIDVLVHYEDGFYDVVVPKIRVQERMQPTKESENSMSNQIAHESIIILAVNEKSYADLLLAQQLGVLETRIYLDESQPASNKTFETEWAIEKLEQIQKGQEEMASQGFNIHRAY